MKYRKFSRLDSKSWSAVAQPIAAEVASSLAVAPRLLYAPRGDGHAVLVLPGLSASDTSTRVLRNFLSARGYAAHPWELGRNMGPAMPELQAELARRLDEVYQAAGKQMVSLVGWSLGGVYARLLAQVFPQKVRQVITLGSPISSNLRTSTRFADEPGSSKNFERERYERLRLLIGKPLPGIPSTAVFTKSDEIVPWQAATQIPSTIAENVEVYASHFSLGFNPAVLYLLADRLAQQPDEWRLFRRRGWKRHAYGPGIPVSDGATSNDSRYRNAATS